MQLLTFHRDLLDRSDPVEVEKPLPLSQLLTSFLPFSNLRPRLPTPPSSSPEEKLPSHAPIELEDPLPYLRLFTNLRCSSDITARPAPDENSFHQVHDIKIQGPQNILKATVEMTIDPMTEQVEELAIKELSSWAEHELGTWIRKRAAEEKDAGNICWAMDSYWSLAKKRAECWIRCERAFREKLVGAGPELRGNSTQDGLDGSDGTGKNMKYQKHELQKYLAKDHLLFRSEEVAFRVSWTIQFDWTGEAESQIKGMAGFPQVCE
jgi:hypothetical protein